MYRSYRYFGIPLKIIQDFRIYKNQSRISVDREKNLYIVYTGSNGIEYSYTVYTGIWIFYTVYTGSNGIEYSYTVYTGSIRYRIFLYRLYR